MPGDPTDPPPPAPPAIGTTDTLVGLPGRLCPACRTPVAEGSAFCSRCGAGLTATSGNQADPLIGAVIDNRYRVVERLGQGGMGAIYLAEHVGIGKRVAVKVLRSHLRSQPELVRRFRREALLVSKLTDPHTITVFDFGVWEGLIYLAMEYLRGEDLGRVLDREGRLPPARALAIAHQMCSSLAEAHEIGLVHRDLKPENVYLLRTNNDEEWVKVLDFGLAKTVREAPEGDSPRGEASFQTGHGALLGTPYFMAPEQVRGDPVDARTDIYALGALIYRMLSGEYPHTGRTPLQVLESHLSGVFRPLSESAPGLRLPDGSEALLRRMLSRDPEGRPGSMREVAEALMTISRRAASSTSQPEQAAEWAHQTWEGARPEVAPVQPAEGPTRDEVDRFERSLRRRGQAAMLVLGLALAGLGAALWGALRGEAPEALRQEVEPNDDPAQATPLSEGVEMRGYIGRRLRRETSDRDVYVLRGLGRGSRVRVTLGAVPGLDLVLEGYDKDGRQLFKVNEAPRDEGESLPGTLLEADPLYLVVRELWVQGEMPLENSTDPYMLLVSHLP